jgi:hypothetical protein
MQRLLTHPELQAHASERCGRGQTEVGAAYDRDCTEASRDRARRWRFLIVDGSQRSEYVELVATHIDPRVSFLVEPLEEAVEHFVASNYPADVRLAALKLESEHLEEPISLPLAERFRSPASSV